MKFQILYGDPPWKYANWTKKKNGAAQAHYKGYTVKQMARWDVGSLAEKDSLIFLWATFPKLEEAFLLLEAWGFEYVTTPFVWRKLSSKRLVPHAGTGFWTMSGAEIVLLGRRGKGIPRVSRGIRQVFKAPVIKPHSRKPAIVRDNIVRLVGDQPRLELFARSHEEEKLEGCDVSRRGWEATGLEYDGRDIEEAIRYYNEL